MIYKHPLGVFYCAWQSPITIIIGVSGGKINSISLEYIKEMVRSKFESTDFEAVKRDIKPFVSDKYILDAITLEMFMKSVESLNYWCQKLAQQY